MSAELHAGNVGDMMLHDGLVNHDTLEEALRRQGQTNQPLARILVEMNAITESVKLNFFNKRFGNDIVSLRDHEIPDVLYTYIPGEMARRHHVIPYKLEGDTLVVAMEDPSDLVVLDNLKTQVGLKIKPVIASSSDIETALEGYPGAEQGDAPIIERAPSGFGKAVKYLFFPIFAFTPLAVIIGMLLLSEEFQRHLLHPPFGMSQNDAIFSLVLIWGLWALFAYEIDGILVNPEHRGEIE